MGTSGLKDTTIRDYGGGWNVSDSDLNLNSRYQPISDNVVRGIDGSFSVRQGFALVADFEDGESVHGTADLSITTTETSPNLDITIIGHGRVTGDHIAISGVTVDVGGIDASEINGVHTILVLDDNTIRVYSTFAASTSETVVIDDADIVFDNHSLGGNIIHDQYFNRKLVVFTDIGEIGVVDDTGNCYRIWSIVEAEALAEGLVPTRRCTHWSSDTFKSTVIACNGYDRDKPVQIYIDDDTGEFKVEFLVDKSTSSNAAVPKADYVVCLQGYVVFIRTEYGDPFLEFSAKGTDGTFTRDPNPADAAEIDLSMITSTVEPTLLGAAPLREKLYTAFYDKGMIGTLGIYDDNGLHVPDFSDTISENGTVSHRTMVALGNDVFMCDYAGVPSVSISQQSGIFVPIRLSDLIAPTIQAHLSNLSEETLRSKAFAVFNRDDRTYMLFVPIYDENVNALQDNPFIFNDDLRKLNYAIVYAPSHKLFENSYVDVSGVVPPPGMTADMIDGQRKVVGVLDNDYFVIQLDGAPIDTGNTVAGGTNVTITPINNETIVYVFEYNKGFKIRRWTRYRGWNFDCACSSQRGYVFMCKALRVFRMGNEERPINADFYGSYKYRAWQNNFDYVVGDTVYEPYDGNTYICTHAHTSGSSSDFRTYRSLHKDDWSLYQGEPIRWALETPWSDMGERARNKIIKYVNIDAEGSDRFTLSGFVNQIRMNSLTSQLMPIRSLDFQAASSGGFGVVASGGFGGGRRTREEKVWPFQLRGKLIRWRYSGETTKKLRIVSHTMYYTVGNIR